MYNPLLFPWYRACLKREKPTQALIVKEPWATMLCNGSKTMEIRGSKTSKVGERIAIARSGSGLLIGEVTIINSYSLDKEKIKETQSQHLAKNIS